MRPHADTEGTGTCHTDKSVKKGQGREGGMLPTTLKEQMTLDTLRLRQGRRTTNTNIWNQTSCSEG